MTSAIRIDRVTKLFGTHAALNDVSYEVPSGTVFALFCLFLGVQSFAPIVRHIVMGRTMGSME